jgi:hypothetical protein
MVASQLNPALADALFGPPTTAPQQPEEPPQATIGDGDTQHQANREFAAAVLTTALEGGIGYWARSWEIKRDPVESWVWEFRLVEYESAMEELGVGNYASLDGAIDVKSPAIQHLCHHVNRDSVVCAIEKILSAGNPCKWASGYRNELAEIWADHELLAELDSDMADNIVQVAVLGEAVYG